MPIRILSPDAAGRVCGVVKATILDRLASRAGTSDVTVVPVSNFPDFRFNPELRAIKGPWVMVDFMEYGANVTEPDHQFGDDVGNICVDVVQGPGWAELDDFACDNPPALYLKRELMAKNVRPHVRPIDWTCGQPAQPIQTRAEFDARPLEVFNCWGYSNSLRTDLHAAIFAAMGRRGIAVHDRIDGLDKFLANSSGRRWLSAFVPWWERHPMADVMAAQQKAKISVSLPGFGMKCFRHAEAPVGAVMAMTNDPLAWSFPWEDRVNCIRLPRDSIFTGLDDTAGRLCREGYVDLYDIYRAGQETIDRYRPDRYVDEYLLPLIREAVA